MEKVTPVELKAMIDDSADIVLINVLSEAAYDDARIPGSYNIPVEEPDFERRVEELVGDPSRKLVVYSTGPEDETSFIAAERLEDAGFSDVAEFDGGLEEWVDIGFGLDSN